MRTALLTPQSDLLHSFGSALGDGAGRLVAGALASGVLWALVGALAGAIAMVMMWRLSLLRRKPVVWNVFAKLSYLLVLIAFVGAAAGIGSVRKVQSNFKSMLTEEMQPGLTARMPTVREYLAARIIRFAPDKRSMKDMLIILMDELRYTPASDTLWENLKATCVNWLIRKYGTELFVEQFQKLVVIKLEALGGAMKVDMYGRAQGQLVQLGADLLVKFGTDASRNVDYAILDRTVPEALVEVIQKTADGYFKTAFRIIGLAFAFVFAAVGAEMLAYFKWHLPREAAAGAI